MRPLLQLSTRGSRFPVPPPLPFSASTMHILAVPRPFVLFPSTHGHGHAAGSFGEHLTHNEKEGDSLPMAPHPVPRGPHPPAPPAPRNPGLRDPTRGRHYLSGDAPGGVGGWGGREVLEREGYF